MNSYESGARQAKVWALAVVFLALIVAGSTSGYYAYKLHVHSQQVIEKTVLIYNGGPEQEIITPTSSQQDTK